MDSRGGGPRSCPISRWCRSARREPIMSTRRSSTNTGSRCGGRPGSTKSRSPSSPSATWCSRSGACISSRRCCGAANGRGRSDLAPTCGHIGKEVVKLLQPYGVKILACDRIDFSPFYKEWNVEQVEAVELWARSDVLTIHLSRNKSTIGLYGAAVLDQLKPGVILVNCARGAIVDEVALKARLESGHIAGAAFDVFATEPANGNPLLDVPNFFGSPHIGATTNESWEAMLRSGMLGIAKAYRTEPGQYPFD